MLYYMEKRTSRATWHNVDWPKPRCAPMKSGLFIDHTKLIIFTLAYMVHKFTNTQTGLTTNARTNEAESYYPPMVILFSVLYMAE